MIRRNVEILLRKIVRGILREAIAARPSRAVSSVEAGLALMRKKIASKNVYVVYVPSIVEQALTSGDVTLESVENGIMGYLVVKPHDGNSWNAGEVKAAATQEGKGFGSMLYKFAMNDYAGGLIPDRTFVSKKARSLWSKFYKDPNAEKKPLDISKPHKTPEPIDDALPLSGTQDNEEDAYLNTAYDASADASQRSDMMQNHEKFVTTMAAHKFNRQIVETMIENIGSEFFSRHFNG